MKTTLLNMAAIMVALVAPFSLCARDNPAVVSTDWLARNLTADGLVLLDIRALAPYENGHIPGSVHSPLSSWAITRDGLTLELPADDAIRDLLGKAGVTPDSFVVVVGRTETDFGRADASRVAWTCLLAGVKNVSVLDGGYTQWSRENRTVTTVRPNTDSSPYTGKINRSSSVSKAYVLSRLGRALIADNRLPDEYFGVAPKSGHIRGAVNLPAPWIFNQDGTYRNSSDLLAMATGVLGTEKSREIIVYCGVGGYASTWWFLLTQLLGYRNVKVYDGSWEEWSMDPKAPVQAFSWN